MTPNNIFDSARDLTQMTDTEYITTAMQRRWLNDALKILSHEAGGVEIKDTSISTVVGQSDYTLPETIFQIKWAEYGGRVLDAINFEEKDLVQLESASIPNGTSKYFLYWNRTISLFPAPSAVETLTIYSLSTHPELAAGSDSSSTAILIDPTFHSYLVDYLAFRMTLKEGTGRHIPFYELWIKGVEDVKTKMIKRKHQQRVPVVRDVYKTVRTLT